MNTCQTDDAIHCQRPLPPRLLHVLQSLNNNQISLNSMGTEIAIIFHHPTTPFIDNISGRVNDVIHKNSSGEDWKICISSGPCTFTPRFPMSVGRRGHQSYIIVPRLLSCSTPFKSMMRPHGCGLASPQVLLVCRRSAILINGSQYYSQSIA